MKFLYNTFKGKKKQIVKVNIDTTTKVKLMTAYDLNKYKQGRTHRYRGGTFNSGEIFFRLPADSIWYVVVEKGPSSNPIEVNASVELLPPDKKVQETNALDAPAPSNGIPEHLEPAPVEESSEEESVAEVNEEAADAEEEEEDRND